MPRKFKKVLAKNLEEFGDVTTLHGVRYITESRSHLVERILWSIGVITSAVLCGIEVAKLYSKWQDSPVITNFAEQSTPVSSIPFPAVTICPEHKVQREYLDIDKKMEWYLSVLADTSNEYNESEHLLVESISLICEFKELHVPMPEFTPTQEHLDKIIEIAPPMSSFIRECYYQSIKLPCSDVFHPILTETGLCYTFNMLTFEDIFSEKFDSNQTIEYPYYLGRRNLTWSIDKGYEKDIKLMNSSTLLQYSYNNREYPRRNIAPLGPEASGLKILLLNKAGDSQQICNLFNGGHLKVILHSPVEFPLTDRNYFYIAPETNNMIAVTPDVTVADEALKPPSYTYKTRGCFYDEERSLFVFKNMTKQNCIFDKTLEMLQLHCNCSYHFLPIKDVNNASLPFCGAGLFESCLMLASVGDCLGSCNEINYRFQVSSTKIDLQPLNYINMKSEDGILITRLNIFFEEASFFKRKKREFYSVTDFTANCGGLLGLFTGFSLITLMEVCYFATLRLGCHFRRGVQDAGRNDAKTM